ncbi:hypothetical protein K490DRAFT_66144 [Saccharata proteae CBS 121410]|uniref:Transmembrane protein n=1 Tax=Saccharata proteae CBS 121410 TaxID=1314787 RepID=A0A9P4HUR9_9PEZI|nr:hypothetical protein K490DRAFT_66144 [Saccharata proteae CBS 121410]
MMRCFTILVASVLALLALVGFVAGVPAHSSRSAALSTVGSVFGVSASIAALPAPSPLVAVREVAAATSTLSPSVDFPDAAPLSGDVSGDPSASAPASATSADAPASASSAAPAKDLPFHQKYLPLFAVLAGVAFPILSFVVYLSYLLIRQRREMTIGEPLRDTDSPVGVGVPLRTRREMEREQARQERQRRILRMLGL